MYIFQKIKFNHIIKTIIPKNLPILIIILISIIRLLQFRFASDSSYYHFGFAIQKSHDENLFYNMNNILWKLPHLSDYINIYLKNITLMHIFSSLLPIFNFALLSNIVSYFNLKKESNIKDKNYSNYNQYIALLIILSGVFFYTIASGHTEQFLLLISFLSTNVIIQHKKNKTTNWRIFNQKINDFSIFSFNGLLLGIGLCSKISFLYIYPQIIIFNLIVLLDGKANQLKKKKIIIYLFINILFSFLIFSFYLLQTNEVFDYLKSIFLLKYDNINLQSYIILKNHIYSEKSDFNISIFNSIKYFFKLSFYPFGMRFPFYLNWYPNLLISISIIIYSFFKKPLRFLFKNLLINYIYIITFFFSYLSYFSSGLHNPRHFFISIVYFILFVYINNKEVYSKFINYIFSASIRIYFLVIGIAFIYMESFGLNLPAKRYFTESNSKTNFSKIKTLFSSLSNKSNVLNMADSGINLFIPMASHYPSPYWQYGINFSNEKLDLSLIQENFQLILLNDDSTYKKKHCVYNSSNIYIFKSKSNINRYKELYNILKDCSTHLSSIDLIYYESSLFRKNPKSIRINLAKINFKDK